MRGKKRRIKNVQIRGKDDTSLGMIWCEWEYVPKSNKKYTNFRPAFGLFFVFNSGKLAICGFILTLTIRNSLNDS